MEHTTSDMSTALLSGLGVITDETASRSSRSNELTRQIGNTPLVRLRSLEPAPGIEVYGKAEWQNPGGSIKDRAALAMIEEGERSGRLTHDKTILDATSGNTGIAYAMIGAARGYRVALCLPRSASEERQKILRAYGAELILTDPGEGSDGAIRAVRELYADHPDRYFYPDQYNNPENPLAHERTTAPEIWRQTGGRITHFVAGLGTSGTFVGTGRALRRLNPQVELIAVQPDSPFNGLEGLKHMATAIVPGIYDETLADVNSEVRTEDAYRMVRWIARSEGLLIGVSSGAALVEAERVALRVRNEGKQGIIVAILPDSGNRYLSDRFWEEED
ncbi:MAG: cysteine synthase family protein [Thermomicrobiales bacterium]|nr:cysteine synthase family protein [Thermomicrobiales bacterium]